LDGFESQTAQTSSQFFPIPSNPCVLGITEQALICLGLRLKINFMPTHVTSCCLNDFIATCP
jgi:hypothetical protein